MAKITLTISATLTATDEDGENDIEGVEEDRGVDLVVDERENPATILRLLFEGFEDRLNRAGIPCGDVSNFT